jgi:hypothetical protein
MELIQGKGRIVAAASISLFASSGVLPVKKAMFIACSISEMNLI